VTSRAADPDSAPAEDDAVPVSVRLGTVVPPEDPEDWTRPLTWVAATGMLLGPLVALAWFLVAPPTEAADPVPGTWIVAAALVAGAVLTGETQRRPGWRFAGTLGCGLFGALLTVLFATILFHRTGLLADAPGLVHAFVASTAGTAGALAASTLMPALAGMPSRLRRAGAPAAIGIAVAALCVQLLFSL
jgi:FtsH-binding integral membrane protein